MYVNEQQLRMQKKEKEQTKNECRPEGMNNRRKSMISYSINNDEYKRSVDAVCGAERVARREKRRSAAVRPVAGRSEPFLGQLPRPGASLRVHAADDLRFGAGRTARVRLKARSCQAYHNIPR